jgi:hypothetical protein
MELPNTYMGKEVVAVGLPRLSIGFSLICQLSDNSVDQGLY